MMLATRWPSLNLLLADKQARQESRVVSAHGLDVWSWERMSKDGRDLTSSPTGELHSDFKNLYSTIGGSVSSSDAGDNQVIDSPPAVMAESEFLVVEANGNLHQQPPAELVEDHHNQMTSPEMLLQQLNINDGLVDDADDNTDTVQEVAESSAASNHGVQRDCVDDNPGHLQEVEPAAAAVIEIAPNIHLPLLSREDVDFIMSLP